MTRAEPGLAELPASVELLCALPDLVVVLDAAGRLAWAPRPDDRRLPRPWAELQGQAPAAVLDAGSAEPLQDLLDRVRQRGATERAEITLATRDLGPRLFEWRASPLAGGATLLVARDITDSTRTQQALRETQSRYERALRGTSEGLWDWDLRGGSDRLSPRWKAMLGFAPDELADTGDGFFDRLHPDDEAPVRAALNAHFRHGAPFDVDLRLRSRDGEYRWFRSRGEAERDAAGQPLRMAGSIADITARKQVEDALRDSQAKFSTMFHTVPVGIALTTLDDGCVVEANEEMARLLGWRADEMIGRRSVDLGAWPDEAPRRRVVEQVLRDGHAQLPALVMRHRLGHDVHVKLSVQRLTLGGRALLLSAVTDLSERVAAEQALQEQREAYEAIFSTASDAIVSIGADGAILLFNPGAERIFGRPAPSMLGRSIDALLPPAQRQRHGADIARFAASNTTRRAMGAGRVQGLGANGQTLELEASISQVSVGGRKVLTAILRDITDRVRAETEALRYQFELSALARQLMAQEKLTTQRLAQGLHDQLGQTLTALRLRHDRERRAGAARDAAGDADGGNGQIGALIDQAITEVRQVLVELRPPLLDDEGLYAALDNEVATRQRQQPQVDLLLEAAPALQSQRWPADVEYALFMIAREALNNAMQHADATVVRIALAGDAGSLQLEVGDDGIGLAAGADRARPGHLGLIGMRERARAIGASLLLEAAAEGGTQVVVRWSGA